MTKIVTLETAIEVCKKHNIRYDYKWSGTNHIKFYLDGYSKTIIMSQGNDARAGIARKVRRDIERAIAQIKR